jgi:hypothetical protein
MTCWVRRGDVDVKMYYEYAGRLHRVVQFFLDHAMLNIAFGNLKAVAVSR